MFPKPLHVVQAHLIFSGSANVNVLGRGVFRSPSVKYPRFGYRRLHLYLHGEMGTNHKKVQRVYRELGLTVKRTRRKHLRRTLQPQSVPARTESAVGAGLRQRCDCRGAKVSHAGCDRQLYPAVSGAGNGERSRRGGRNITPGARIAHWVT